MPEDTRSPVAASIERLREDFDHLLGAAWANGERALDAFGIKTEKSWTPAVDVVESEQQVLVFANLPGVVPAEIDLRLVGNMLTLEGKINALPCGASDVRHLSERHSGPFSRSIPLPAPVAAEQVTAEYRAGVLKVTLGKQEVVRPRHIQIVSGETENATPAAPPAQSGIGAEGAITVNSTPAE